MSSFLDSTIGIQLVVLFLGTLLQGMGILQCWLYFHWYPRDSWQIKSTVSFLIFLETLQTAALFAIAYRNLITNYGNIDAIFIVTGWDLAQQVAGFISALIVQFYFAWTLYAFSKNNIYYSLLIVTLSLVSFGGGIGCFRIRNGGYFLSKGMGRNTVAVQTGAALACDLAITMSLCVVFCHRRTGTKSTDSLLDTLIVYLSGRGILTLIAAAQSFICFLALPGTFYFILGLLLSSKLYMNSMLFSLNSRQHVHNRSSMVSINFMPPGTRTEEHVQTDMVKLESLEACTADANSSGETSNKVLSIHRDDLSLQPIVHSSTSSPC